MAKLREAVCPSCGTQVTVTYWPYNVPLYTVHFVRGSNRECRQSLRPVVVVSPPLIDRA
jgi:prepilin signal peptidase PulO-like enzyme (type II secretory pathway)